MNNSEPPNVAAPVAAQYLLAYTEALVSHAHCWTPSTVEQAAAEILLAASLYVQHADPLYELGETLLGMGYDPADVLRAGIRIGMNIDAVNEVSEQIKQWETEHEQLRNHVTPKAI